MQKINVVHFSYKPEFSSLFGLSLKEEDTGIIAQEVQAVLPEAVTNAGGIALPNGEVYNDFLVVNKVRGSLGGGSPQVELDFGLKVCFKRS